MGKKGKQRGSHSSKLERYSNLNVVHQDLQEILEEKIKNKKLDGYLGAIKSSSRPSYDKRYLRSLLSIRLEQDQQESVSNQADHVNSMHIIQEQETKASRKRVAESADVPTLQHICIDQIGHDFELYDGYDEIIKQCFSQLSTSLIEQISNAAVKYRTMSDSNINLLLQPSCLKLHMHGCRKAETFHQLLPTFHSKADTTECPLETWEDSSAFWTGCPHLNFLELVDYDDFDIEIFTELTIRMTSIEHLKVTNSFSVDMGPIILEQLIQFESLKTLSFDSCPWLNDKLITRLLLTSRINCLNIYNCNAVTDELIKEFKIYKDIHIFINNSLHG